MDRVQVKAEPRTISTKGYLRQLRSAGMVPGIVYGKKETPVTVAVEAKEIGAVLHSHSGANTLVDLMLDGKKDTVMIKSLTRDILLADRINHVDFLRISLLNKLDVNVPLVLTGDAKGVSEGGVLQQVLREISLKVLPTEIPDSFVLDVSSLGLGESLTASELQIPAGAELLTDPSETVVTVVAPRGAEDGTVEAAETGDEAAEAEAETAEEAAAE
jgi:large subunit ribosomal protein L25